MNFLAAQLRSSPERARVLPYVIIVVLTFIQDSYGGPSRYWIYLAKVFI